jgi:hypothetical protein
MDGNDKALDREDKLTAKQGEGREGLGISFRR